MKTKYYANYNVNNGQHVRPSYEYTSKREAIRSIREIALGNVYAGNAGSWTVTNLDGEIIASGRVR